MPRPVVLGVRLRVTACGLYECRNQSYSGSDASFLRITQPFVLGVRLQGARCGIGKCSSRSYSAYHVCEPNAVLGNVSAGRTPYTTSCGQMKFLFECGGPSYSVYDIVWPTAALFECIGLSSLSYDYFWPDAVFLRMPWPVVLCVGRRVALRGLFECRGGSYSAYDGVWPDAVLENAGVCRTLRTTSFGPLRTFANAAAGLSRCTTLCDSMRSFRKFRSKSYSACDVL